MVLEQFCLVRQIDYTFSFFTVHLLFIFSNQYLVKYKKKEQQMRKTSDTGYKNILYSKTKEQWGGKDK